MTRSEATGPVSPDPSAAGAGDLDGARLPDATDAGLANTDLESMEAALLEADLRELAAERDELRGTAQRIQADFENYRKRVARDQAALADRATERLVEALLPALDGLEMAVVSLADADEKVRKGVELAVGELTSALERHGLARIADLDVAFDPNQHEAVMQDDGDGDPHVGAVLRTGYALNGRVLRPAMVKVTRTGAESTGGARPHNDVSEPASE
jgi:molecular chaperone GrpE